MEKIESRIGACTGEHVSLVHMYRSSNIQYLMKDTAVVRGDIALVEEKTFLYYKIVSLTPRPGWKSNAHRLKLLTGVDTST